MSLLEAGGTAGTIKKFNFRRGYGFIVDTSGQDVFVHQSVLEAAGINKIVDGAGVWFEKRKDPKKAGKFLCTAIRLAGSNPSDDKMASEESGCETLRLKWFNRTMGYGFFMRPNKSDLFVHVSVIERSGLETLEENTDYQVTFGKGKKGLEVKKIEMPE